MEPLTETNPHKSISQQVFGLQFLELVYCCRFHLYAPRLASSI